jgi:hypothetical protein
MTIENNTKRNRPVSGPHSKKGWSRNKKIGVGLIVLLAIVVIVSIAVISDKKEQPIQQLATSNRGQSTDPAGGLNPIDQPVVTGPDGMQP